MDLHTWITQQVEQVERLIEENEWPSSQREGVRLRCEADRRILARHRLDPDMADSTTYAAACEGCGIDDKWGLPEVDNLNDCPELLDLGHAHGLTEQILASLDRPQPAEPKSRMKTAPAQSGARQLAQLLRIAPYTPMSDVPAALRGPNWKP